MSSLMASIGYNFSGQLIARIISFGINMYLLRVVDNSVLGLVNVRLTLLYNTILFLTREPMRKASILKTSIPQFVNIIWLSPVICGFLSIICITLWELFSSSSKDVPWTVLCAFPFSAFIEAFAEPFAVISLRFSLTRHFAIAQSLLIFLQRVFVFAFIFTTNSDHFYIFAIAQIFASFIYLLFHLFNFYRFSTQSYPELSQFNGFSSFLPQLHHGLDKESLKSLSTVFGHSILKQILTDGSGYVMTFTDVLTLKNQAVFDAIERVGSLVARIVLNPLEESCFAYFSNSIGVQSKDSHDKMVNDFSTILHISCVIGMIVCVFGIPYSSIAVWLYGGNLLYENGGAILLSLYCFYVFIMAINGITECFAFASMNNREVFSHGGFLSVAAVLHLALNILLCYHYEAAGFIIANCVNMSLRILYSWRYIRGYLDEKTPSLWELMPSFSTIIYLLFTLGATSFSLLLFGSTPGLSHNLAHVAIGAVLLLLLVLHIAQHDPVFHRILSSINKQYSQ